MCLWSASLTYGKPGVLHGSYSYVLQDEDGQTDDVHSASAGLDYPGVGPEHSHWKSTGRVEYRSCRDDEALATFDLVARTEGILPALESSHAIAKGMEVAKERGKDEIDVAKTKSSSFVSQVVATKTLLRFSASEMNWANRKPSNI